MLGSRLGLLKELLRRDIDVRWRGSYLGGAWAFLQPLGWMLLYMIVFGTVLKIPPPAGAEDHGFGLFLLSGLIPFLAFQEGLTRSSSVWHENSNILKKIKLPPSLYVLTVCLASLVLELGGLMLIVIYEAWRGSRPSRVGWIFAGLIIQFLMTILPGFWLAVVGAFFRDLLLALPFGLMAIFYLTPIVYPKEMVPEHLVFLISANPVSWLLEFFRAAFVGGQPPAISTTLLVGTGLLLAAWWSARFADRLRPHLADVL